MKTICTYFKLLYKQRNETENRGKMSSSGKIRQVKFICSIAFTHGGYLSIQCIVFLNPCIYIICTLIHIAILEEINSWKLDCKNKKIITLSIKITCIFTLCVSVCLWTKILCVQYILKKGFQSFTLNFATGGSMMEDFWFCFLINYILFKLCLQLY